MALRMMDYTVTIWRQLGKEDLGPGGEYPFMLPIVIYNGERRWTAARDVADLLAPVPEELLGYQPRQRYLLIEIRAQDPASLPLDNVLAMIARFEQAPTAKALEELAGSLADWRETIGVPELAGVFVAWITQVLVQRFGPAGRELQRKLRNQEEGTMTTLIERARKWGEERDQLWLQKGIEKGIQRERELVSPAGREKVRSRHRRTASAGAGADLRTGRHRARRRRCDRLRERRGVPPAGPTDLTSTAVFPPE